MMKPEDRRSHPRLSACLKVQVAAGDEAREGLVRDMSEGGVFVETREADLTIGQTLRLKVLGLLRDRSPAVLARVVRRTSRGFGLNFVP